MKSRCYYPKNQYYKHYGGRGITVCDEWRNDYIKFRDWAMCNGYSDDKSLDRIDVNGDYEPSNCRWATRKEQANNTTRNVTIEYEGSIFTISELADAVGIDMHTLWARLNRLGWSIEKSVRTPVRKINK
jgi:hypothetical protein